MTHCATKDPYTCNGCSSAIPIDRARVSCHYCPDYHLCANCFVTKQFYSPHVESHSTMTFKLSGFVVPPPPGFNRRTPPPLPPRTIPSTSAQQNSRFSEIPTANWGSLWNVIKAPLEKNGNRKESADNIAVRHHAELTPRNESLAQDGFEIAPLNKPSMDQFEASLPKPVFQIIERVDSTAPSYPQPAKWELLFDADGTPTPIFVALMSIVFSHLDPLHTGYLSPEVYSGFLNAQEYPAAENICELHPN
jgi:Zinc finger, ZZ type